jgi:membrane fusion protein, multidrug efflux system
MKKVILIVLVIGLALGAKFLFFPGNSGGDPAKGGGKPKGPSPVKVFVVNPQPLQQTVQVPGVVLPTESVDLMPEAAGRVTGIYFTEGKPVSKGQLLVKLNDAELQAQLSKVKQQIKVQADRLNRLRKLLEINGTSREEVDLAETQVQGLQADQDLIAAQIAKTEIRAPFAGIIGLRQISEGAYIAPGTKVATLVEGNQLKLSFSLPGFQAALVDPETTVNCNIPGDTTVYTAKIFASDAIASDRSRLIEFRSRFNGNPRNIIPGRSLAVDVPLRTVPAALMLPTEAIIPILKGQKVFIAKNGKAEERKVLTGYRNAAMVEITDGLQPGDSVITTGIMSLKPGSDLKIITPKPKK